MSSPEHKQFIWNLIEKIKVGMLVTEDEDESVLRGRPMHLVQDAYDGTLFFYTSKKSSKVFEIRDNRDVCITFSDPDNQVYVSLSGKAQLTQDRELIDRYWNPWAEAWFENGKQDPDVAVLKIKISKGEHWDADENKLIQAIEIAKSNVTSSTPDLGDNEKFG
ncbi:MAG: pyridoxamine 5'-phosphate oxidase family protein [Cyclobacteriaceae bacterium]